MQFHEKDYDKILSIISQEGESIALDKYVMAIGNVEEWLNNLLKMSHSSVHEVIRQAYVAISDHNFDIMEFLGTYPAQVENILRSWHDFKHKVATESTPLTWHLP